jgi:hypothetical protein
MRNEILNNWQIKQDIDDVDKGAVYFLMLILVIIVTFTLFKSEILQIIFSNLM